MRIVWPLRSRWIGVRFGAGGFCGGFGLGIASRQTFDMYVSRVDRFVIVWLASARPLLITPANPEHFVWQTHALAARGSTAHAN